MHRCPVKHPPEAVSSVHIKVPNAILKQRCLEAEVPAICNQCVVIYRSASSRCCVEYPEAHVDCVVRSNCYDCHVTHQYLVAAWLHKRNHARGVVNSNQQCFRIAYVTGSVSVPYPYAMRALGNRGVCGVPQVVSCCCCVRPVASVKAYLRLSAFCPCEGNVDCAGNNCVRQRRCYEHRRH